MENLQGRYDTSCGQAVIMGGMFGPQGALGSALFVLAFSTNCN